jgi:hypothetical protein
MPGKENAAEGFNRHSPPAASWAAGFGVDSGPVAA